MVVNTFFNIRFLAATILKQSARIDYNKAMEETAFIDQLIQDQPLAERMRPTTLDEFVGQSHLLANGKLLRSLIEHDHIPSMIFWGPPGVGKTTLARLIANTTHKECIVFSAVTSGIKVIKEIMVKTKDNHGKDAPIVFVDEIHRFNKAQQDAFLPYVEAGNIILIGATTENPSFEVNGALLSRCKVFVLNPLTSDDIFTILKNALVSPKGYGGYPIHIEEDTLHMIASFSNGDARMALSTLEMAILNGASDATTITIDAPLISQITQRKSLLYDKKGEEHYNLISALHKSMRNSDPDAALYWLARMLEAGEDPLYVARRMIRFASEDIGQADPKALQLAVAAYQAAHYIGMPECSVNLAQVVIYMSVTQKSNSSYLAYEAAKANALNELDEPVPLVIRNAPTSLMEQLNYGKGYQYAHDLPTKIADMQCLPDHLKDHTYYHPNDVGLESKMKQRLETIKSIKAKLHQAKSANEKEGK